MTGPQVPSLAIALEVINRRGVDGEGFVENARKVEAINKQTVEAVYALATANCAADDYAALKGSLVMVVDDTGRTVYYVMVLDVRVTLVKQVFTSCPAGTNYLIQADWALKPTG